MPSSDSEILEHFVGRGAEIASLHDYYRTGGRFALIHGYRGTGKTMLARVFQLKSGSLFPGGTRYYHAHHFPQAVDFTAKAKPKAVTDRELITLDDLDAVSEQQRKAFTTVVDTYPNLSLLAISAYDVDVGKSGLSLHLGGLSEHEFVDLMARRLGIADRANYEKLYSIVSGNPLLAELATSSIREGLIKWAEIEQAFRAFDAPAILGPDGTPFDDTIHVAQPIIHDVQVVNADLLARIKADPAAMRALSSRQFEELTAELLTKLGYDVQLTPPSKDGGFDMYAAKRDDVGRFLYLVECKRYTPPHKVGIGVIRSLYGVVQKENANAGLVVTSSFFTEGAKDFEEVREFQIQLSDFFRVKKWLGVI